MQEVELRVVADDVGKWDHRQLDEAFRLERTRALFGRRVENRLETPFPARRILPRKERCPCGRGRDAAVKDNLLRREAVDFAGFSRKGNVPLVRLDSDQLDVKAFLPRGESRVV